MYSFDNLSPSLGSISSVLALPDSRGRQRKLLDNFSHESDVTSLQDPFTSRPYKTPFYFYYCVLRKIPRGILFQIHVEYSPSSRLLVSSLTVYATALRIMFPSELVGHAPLYPEKEHILGSLQSRNKDSHSAQRERVTNARKFPQNMIPQTHIMDVTLNVLVYTGCHDDTLHTHWQV